MVNLRRGDCLSLMAGIPDGSVDMILCDLPYGILNKSNRSAKWDSVLPMDRIWHHYRRIIKPNGAIVLFGSGMFTAKLMQSNKTMWRYNLIWDKNAPSGFLNANRMPLRRHEDICVFYKKLPTYHPQMVKVPPHKRNHSKGSLKSQSQNNCYGDFVEVQSIITDEKFPTSIITIPKEHCVGKFFHPTQKPVALCEWLIRTYTDPGDTVLDNCMGGGSAGVAAVNTDRSFVGIELDPDYFSIAKSRIEDAQSSSSNC